MTVAELASTAVLLGQPHHDGSEAYVVDASDDGGGVVRLRVPRGTDAGAVALRYVRDGEPRGVAAVVDEETETEAWWRAEIPGGADCTRYRWLLSGGEVGYAWVNGAGVVHRDVADDDDFVLAPAAQGPGWHLRSVVYEIFPDRFASSGLDVEAPPWAIRREWDDLPTGEGPETPVEWFGGDLRGIEQRLDHVGSLGASALYLRPIFPAESTHRYDATSFDRVDPLLGGDEAFASLAQAAHARGIRLVGDLTTNHCGSGHEWFVAARNGEAPEREFFYFDDSLPHGYESWYGVPSLPKLDWRSPDLRSRMLGVARRWLDAGLDGWRIDAANMVGRFRDIDLNRDVARALRDASGGALVVAEHGHDYRRDLTGDGWHGVMNYAGFLRPVWTWLRGDDVPASLRRSFWGVPGALPRLPGGGAVATMRAFRAGIPWDKALHSWTLVDSYDTPRFRTIAGGRDAQLVGVGLQMTTPGVPMICAGDELGLEGAWGEDARRPMPWTRPESWDRELLADYRRLIAVRRASDALARGGIRYAHVGADAIAYLREAAGERLLCLASRDEHEPVRLPLDALAARDLQTLYGEPAACVDGQAVLPAHGPSFHVWRLIDG